MWRSRPHFWLSWRRGWAWPRSTLWDQRVFDVKSVNVLTSDGRTKCFATMGRDISTGWQLGSEVKVQAYLHAVADCSDGASFDSPFTAVVPNDVRTVNFWFDFGK